MKSGAARRKLSFILMLASCADAEPRSGAPGRMTIVNEHAVATGGMTSQALGAGATARDPAAAGSAGVQAPAAPDQTRSGNSAGSPMNVGAAAPSTPSVPSSSPAGGRDPSMLPTPKEPCPMMASGTLTMLGIQVSLQVGTKVPGQKGPLFIGWGGAFGNNEILQEGGVLAGIMGSNKQGIDTGNGNWFTGDYDTADQVVACAIEQLDIDPRRIWTGGHSAGGLQAGTMALWRSGYLAAAVPSSGGIVARPGIVMWQDPNHVPAVMTMHGAMGKDVVVIEFTESSLSLDRMLTEKGGFAVDCDHGGGHEGPPAPLRAASLEFLRAHPFGVDPEPYAASLPSTFPQYCTTIR